MDDLLEMLDVSLPEKPGRAKPAPECGQPAPAKVRHTDWSNVGQFRHEGYIARVRQITCECCGTIREAFEGVFSVEVKIGTGARRLQALGRGQQWPMAEAGKAHACEVSRGLTQFCPDCIRVLGFSREVEAADTPHQITIGE